MQCTQFKGPGWDQVPLIPTNKEETTFIYGIQDTAMSVAGRKACEQGM